MHKILSLVSFLSETALARSVNDLPAHPQHGSPVDDEVGPLGAHINEALALASSLAHLGLDMQEISVPRCVVLG